MDRDTPVVIVGGGIGGLTAAIALRQVGIQSTLFEHADDISKTQVGSGLSLATTSRGRSSTSVSSTS